MKLSKFIEEVGVPRVVSMTGVSRQQVYLWGSLNSAPSVKHAYKLIKESNGLLSWEDIYDDYARKQFSTRKKPTIKKVRKSKVPRPISRRPR